MKASIKIIIFAILVLGLKQINPAQDQTVKTETKVDSVAVQGATIYFYRAKSFAGSALEPLIFCNDKKIAKMDNGRYFAVGLGAGENSCHIGEKRTGFEIDLKPGEIRYVKVTIETGFWKGRGVITLMQPEQARFEIKKLKPLGVDKIKDRTLVTVYEGVDTKVDAPPAN